MGMPFCGGRKWNQLTEKGVEECRGGTLNKKTADIKRSRLTQSNKNKKTTVRHNSRDQTGKPKPHMDIGGCVQNIYIK